jgi:hypothetical protein
VQYHCPIVVKYGYIYECIGDPYSITYDKFWSNPSKCTWLKLHEQKTSFLALTYPCPIIYLFVITFDSYFHLKIGRKQKATNQN